MNPTMKTFFLVLSGAVLAVFAQEAPVGCEYPPECAYPAMLNITSCSCFCTYEEHQDPSKFFVVIPNFPIKIPMSCSATLVWSQQECTCVRPSVVTDTVVEDVYANAVDCKVLADIRSDGMEFKNFDGYYTKRENGGLIMLENVPGAVDGKAARFEGTSLYFAVFEYNDLTSTSFFKLRVNPDDSNQTYAENNQYILSDACPGHPNATTELIYNPASGNFTLKMRTAWNSEAMCEGVAPNADGWFDISISVSNGETSWTINDSQCPMLSGNGNIYNSKCGLTLGGNPMTDSNAQDFYGYVDSVKVIKHCAAEPVPIAA